MNDLSLTRQINRKRGVFGVEDIEGDKFSVRALLNKFARQGKLVKIIKYKHAKKTKLQQNGTGERGEDRKDSVTT